MSCRHARQRIADFRPGSGYLYCAVPGCEHTAIADERDCCFTGRLMRRTLIGHQWFWVPVEGNARSERSEAE
jgi:hypothetical protein